MMLAALLLAAAPADRAADPVGFDVRCLITAARLMQSQDAAMRANALGAAMYFYGRVDSELAESEIESRMLREAQALRTEDPGAVMRACGQYIVVRGQFLQDVGRRVDAREQAQRTH
jgi:hypothetical protein